MARPHRYIICCSRRDASQLPLVLTIYRPRHMWRPPSGGYRLRDANPAEAGCHARPCHEHQRYATKRLSMFHKLRVALPVLLLAGCGGNSSSSSTPSIPVAPTATVSSIAVSGNSPALGETSQFTATATLPTGATQDVTAQATWQSSDAAVATVSSAGVVRSMAAGDADITATYSGVRGSQHVRVAAAVVPARTLTGIITDDRTGLPIVDQAEAQIM